MNTLAPTSKTFVLVLSFYSPDGNELSFPLASISAYIKKHLPFVEVHMEPVLAYRKDEDSSPASWAKRMVELKPDLIAISIMSPHWPPMDAYLREVRSLLPDSPLLVGGYQAILASEETIAHPSVDYACVGDGEIATAELIRQLRGESDAALRGIWRSQPDGQIIRSLPILSDDLSDIPLPDYTAFEKNGSLKGVNLSIFGPRDLFILPVMTGRGCPYKCTYCCNTPLLEYWKHKGKFLRKYDPEILVDEFCRLRDKYGVQYFEFWDELFMSNMKFVWQFLDLYKKRIGLPFSINSRVEKMDERFCSTAAEAGCHTIWFGIESGCETYRTQRLGRKMSNQEILTAAENARKFNIRRLTFNIVGMPFETKDNLMETLALNRTIQPEFFYFFTYIPLRGTPLYEFANKNGLLDDSRSAHYQEGLVSGSYHFNIREHAEGVSHEDFNIVCQEMKAFQDQNNRLDFSPEHAAH